ncbi:MAG: hypothetical protein ACD_79C00194G0001 [uncultured bacterium]|nr:MAG: hypothetical protein ACD_79C00194G0001 [uncultured bacterium]
MRFVVLIFKIPLFISFFGALLYATPSNDMDSNKITDTNQSNEYLGELAYCGDDFFNQIYPLIPSPSVRSMSIKGKGDYENTSRYVKSNAVVMDGPGMDIVPFCIDKDDDAEDSILNEYIPGYLYTLKEASGKNTLKGNYQALRLSNDSEEDANNGANKYKENIINGYRNKLGIVTTKTGNMSGPTIQGINERLQLVSNGNNSKAYVIVPVCNIVEDSTGNSLVSGSSSVKVEEFKIFYLQYPVAGSGNENYLQAIYLRDASPDDLKWGVQLKDSTEVRSL